MESIRSFTPLVRPGYYGEIAIPNRVADITPEQHDILRTGIKSDLPDTRLRALKAGMLKKTSASHVRLLDRIRDLGYLSTLGLAMTSVTGSSGMPVPAVTHTQKQQPAIERTSTVDRPAPVAQYQYSSPNMTSPLYTPYVNWTPDMKALTMFDAFDLPSGMDLPPLDLPSGMGMPQFPGNLQGLDDSSFIEQLVRAKQDALRNAAEVGALNPSQNNNQPNQGGKGTLEVNAHGYEEGGVYHPVQDIKISEHGNYKNRTHESYTNYGYNPEQSLSLDSAKNGQYYNVTVTWEGGESRTYQVKMDSNDGSQTFSAYH